MKKKKKEERDGMQSEHESGRNASTPGWHVPRISRSIVQRMVIQIYIAQWEVSESIHRLCLKSIPLPHIFSTTSSNYTQ